jgi:hypothetical protein
MCNRQFPVSFLWQLLWTFGNCGWPTATFCLAWPFFRGVLLFHFCMVITLPHFSWYLCTWGVVAFFFFQFCKYDRSCRTLTIYRGWAGGLVVSSTWVHAAGRGSTPGSRTRLHLVEAAEWCPFSKKKTINLSIVEVFAFLPLAFVSQVQTPCASHVAKNSG